MLGYTPRVNGNWPGRPMSRSTSGRSRSVYSGRTGSPLSVVNGASRSGVERYASSQPSSGVWTCSVATRASLESAGQLSQEPARDDEPLDLGGPLVELGDLRVAVVALGRELARVAVAAEDLDGLAGLPAGDGGGEELGLRALDGVRAAGLLQPRGAVRQRARRLDLGLHVGELVRDRLETRDRAAEGVALRGVRAREVERGLGDADRLRGDADPAAVERRERDPHAAPLRAERLAGRLVEGEVGGRRGVEAELLLLARDAEAVRAAADGVRRDLAVALGEDVEDVRVRAVGDPLLGAGYPVLGVRAREHRAGVAAAARLGQRERGDLVALRERRHEALDLLGRAVVEDGQRAGAGVDGEGDADARVGTGDLFEDEDVAEEVGARAARLLGDADAHEPELAELAEDRFGEVVVAVPLRGGGRDDVVGEAPGEIADLALLVGQVVAM